MYVSEMVIWQLKSMAADANVFTFICECTAHKALLGTAELCFTDLENVFAGYFMIFLFTQVIGESEPHSY